MESNRVAGFSLSILASLKFFWFLFNGTFRKLDMLLHLKAYLGFGKERDGKVISILEALTYLIKLLVELTVFLYFGYTFDLNFIIIIALQWADGFRIDY